VSQGSLSNRSRTTPSTTLDRRKKCPAIRKYHHLNMADLYIAVRSDTTEVVKVGRSDDAYRRCAEVAAGQCFRVRPLAIFPGAGEYETQAHVKLRPLLVTEGPSREWFHASLAEVCEVVAACIAGDKPRPVEPPRETRPIKPLLELLAPVKSPARATEAAQINQLAVNLFGHMWEMAIKEAGLRRVRAKTSGHNLYRYTMKQHGLEARSFVSLDLRPTAGLACLEDRP